MISAIITAALIASNIPHPWPHTLLPETECKISNEEDRRSGSATIKNLQNEICEMNRTRAIKCPKPVTRYCKRNTLVKINGKMVCRQCAKKAANNG